MNGGSSSTFERSPGDDDGPGASTASVRSRLKQLFDHLCHCFGTLARMGLSSADDEPSRSTHDHDIDGPVRFEQFPDREHPLTYPGRDLSEINPTDVVAVETEDGVRLSIPENPDATIVSDNWVPIER